MRYEPHDGKMLAFFRHCVAVVAILCWATVIGVAWLLSQDYSPKHADEDVEAIEWAANKVLTLGKSTIKLLTN